MVVMEDVWCAMGTLVQPVMGAIDQLIDPFKTPPRAPALPAPHDPLPESSQLEMDATLARLQAAKARWVAVPAAARCAAVDECLRRTLATAGELAAAGARAKGAYENGLGEEFGAVVPLVTGLYEYRKALQAGGQRRPTRLKQRQDGQWVAQTWPNGMLSTFFPRFEGEVWIQPGRPPSQGQLYKDKAAGKLGPGRVSLVLGAGNQLPVVALDILYKLLSCDEVVIVKMNPVNEYLGPLLRKAFQPFARDGFLEFAYGGKAVGEYLVHHPLVETIHLTGSADTYNAVVWGSPTAKRVGQPPLSKVVTAELGNVTPYLVVPGPWSEADLEYHADNVVSGLVHNAGHNCLKAEVLVVAEDWPLRERFLSYVRAKLSGLSQRVGFYPGSEKRHAAFKARFPGAEALGRPLASSSSDGGGPAGLPWLLAVGLRPDEAATDTENWCGVLQEVVLPGVRDAGLFLDAAVAFANERCWGSLCCSLYIHPETQKQHAEAYEAALSGLRYGSVCVNAPCITGFSATSLVWGAFPGNTPHDIGSGNDLVHNTYMFDFPQKAVLRAPWRYSPRPMWSCNQTGNETLMPASFRFIAAQDSPLVALVWLHAVAYHALRGSWRRGRGNAPEAAAGDAGGGDSGK